MIVVATVVLRCRKTIGNYYIILTLNRPKRVHVLSRGSQGGQTKYEYGSGNIPNFRFLIKKEIKLEMVKKVIKYIVKNIICRIM